MRNFEREEKYLMLTLHDNDFYAVLMHLGEIVSMFVSYYNSSHCRKVDELEGEEFEYFSRKLREIFIPLGVVCKWINWGDYAPEDCDREADYLNGIEISIVTSKDLTRFDNGEYVLVQLTGEDKGYIFLM